MNDFEFFLNDRANEVKNRISARGDKPLSEPELFKLVLMEITYGELFIVLRDFPNADTRPILEKCIYVEARCRGFQPDVALAEMTRQISERFG